jgi:hypothetical protein
MAPLRSVSRSEGLSARRWDALILGSGISGLIAASRIAMNGARVLVLEEDRAHAAFPGLREPFSLGGAGVHGLLEGCLKEFALPLIERRRVETRELALQVVGPDVRLDVGVPERTVPELVAWDLAKPDVANGMVRALVEAAEAERRAMLGSPVVRVARRVARPRPGTQGSHVRGLPAEAASPPEAAREVLEAEARALSNLAVATPGPEARARLLGSLLAGRNCFPAGPPWLSGLLRQRARAVQVEFRSISGPFELVETGEEPGVLTSSGQLLVGKALILAAAGTAIASTLAPDARPDFLEAGRVARRRLSLHFTCKPGSLPTGMSDRVVLAEDGDGLGAVTLALHRSPQVSEDVELVARGIVPMDPLGEVGLDTSQWEDQLEARVRSLLRFAGRKLLRRKGDRPTWDDDDWLEDPPPGQGWPTEIDLRATARPPVYRLDRCGVAGLGLEGDLLLGWRGGDALAAELR